MERKRGKWIGAVQSDRITTFSSFRGNKIRCFGCSCGWKVLCRHVCVVFRKHSSAQLLEPATSSVLESEFSTVCLLSVNEMMKVYAMLYENIYILSLQQLTGQTHIRSTISGTRADGLSARWRRWRCNRGGSGGLVIIGKGWRDRKEWKRTCWGLDGGMRRNFAQISFPDGQGGQGANRFSPRQEV